MPAVAVSDDVIAAFLANPDMTVEGTAPAQEAPSGPADAIAALLDGPAKSTQDKPAEKPGPVKETANEAAAIAKRAADLAGQRAAVLHDRVAALPTPGGAAALLATLIFFVWVLVPVSRQGLTRIQLLWATLTGRASLTGRKDVRSETGVGPAPATGGGGGSSGFGDGGVPMSHPAIAGPERDNDDAGDLQTVFDDLDEVDEFDADADELEIWIDDDGLIAFVGDDE